MNCVRLKWTRNHNRLDASVDSGKEFGLCPIESLLGMVHVVPCTEITNTLGVNNTYKRKVIEICAPPDRWEGQMYYVNRFFDTSLDMDI